MRDFTVNTHFSRVKIPGPGAYFVCIT